MATPIYDDLADSVPLLLHFDGDFTDSSSAGQAMTFGSGAAINATQQRFGSGCLDLPNANAFVRSPSSVALGVGDAVPFALEASVFFPGGLPAETYFLQGTSALSGAGGTHLWLRQLGSGLQLYFLGSQSPLFTGVLAADRWHQVLVRSYFSAPNYLGELWLDGTMLWTRSAPVPPSGMLSTGDHNGTWIFGKWASIGSPGGPCRLDEVRLTVGATRVYEPQSRPFSNQAPPTYWPGAGSAWPGGTTVI